jgi:hypothetical protein
VNERVPLSLRRGRRDDLADPTFFGADLGANRIVPSATTRDCWHFVGRGYGGEW